MTKYKIGQLLTYIIPRREQQGLLQDAKLRIELLKEKKLRDKVHEPALELRGE